MPNLTESEVLKLVKSYGKDAGRAEAILSTFKGKNTGSAAKNMRDSRNKAISAAAVVSKKDNNFNPNLPPEAKSRKVFSEAKKIPAAQALLKKENGSTMARRQALEAEVRKRK